MDTPNETKETKNTLIPPKDPYFNIEFDEFLKNIGDAKLTSWTIYAEVLGISRTTIERWKKHPLARSAIMSAIASNLEAMERCGKEDWKMYREKLSMLGVKQEQVIKHQVNPDEVSEILDKIETDYGDLGSKAKRQMVETKPPVQNKG